MYKNLFFFPYFSTKLIRAATVTKYFQFFVTLTIFDFYLHLHTFCTGWGEIKGLVILIRMGGGGEYGVNTDFLTRKLSKCFFCSSEMKICRLPAILM